MHPSFPWFAMQHTECKYALRHASTHTTLHANRCHITPQGDAKTDSFISLISTHPVIIKGANKTKTKKEPVSTCAIVCNPKLTYQDVNMLYM